MIRLEFSEDLPIEEILALHAGDLEGAPSVSALLADHTASSPVPAYSLSAWEVSNLAPAIARAFDLALPEDADEEVLVETLLASPLVEVAEPGVLPAPARPAATVARSDSGFGSMMTGCATGCGYVVLAIVGIGVLLALAGFANQLVGS